MANFLKFGDGGFKRLFSGWGGASLLAILVLAAVATGLDNGFIYDDDPAITNNPVVTGGEFLEAWESDIWGNRGPRNCGAYRPLMVMSFQLQWMLWPDNPLPFQLLNLLLYVFLAVISFRLLERLFPAPLPFFAVAFFALHPVNSEVMHNIIQRSSILAAVFTIAYMKILLGGSNNNSSKGRIGLAALVFFLALISKETGVAAPVLMLAADRYRPGGAESWGGVLSKHKVSLALALMVFSAYFSLRNIALAGFSMDVSRIFNPLVALPEIWRHLNIAWLFLSYFHRFLWPFPQPMEFVYDQLTVYGPGSGLFLVLIWIAAILLVIPAIWALKRREPIALGAIIFVIALIPAAQTVFLGTVVFADRFLFLPSLGLAVSAVATVMKVSEITRIKAPYTVLFFTPLLLFFIFYQFAVAPRWESNIVFFKHLAGNSRLCSNAQEGYGKFLCGAGRFNEAKKPLELAVSIAPFNEDAWHWLGKAQFESGNLSMALFSWSKAEEHAVAANFEEMKEEEDRLMRNKARELFPDRPEIALFLLNRLIERLPDDAEILSERIKALAVLDRKEDALRELNALKARFPENIETFSAHAFFAENSGDYNEALVQYDLALMKNPKRFDLRRARAMVLDELGRYLEAIDELNLLIREDYHDKASKEAIMQLRMRKAEREKKALRKSHH